MILIKTKAELFEYLEKMNIKRPSDRIAVEGLIFTPNGKILLEKRGPKCRDEVGKLEGVGGRLKGDDLLRGLRDEFDQEIAAKKQGLEIKIDRLLEIRQVQFEDPDVGMLDWIVVSHLCRLTKGTPAIGEPEKIDSLHELTLSQLFRKPKRDLSNSTIAARKTYEAKYGRQLYYMIPDENER